MQTQNGIVNLPQGGHLYYECAGDADAWREGNRPALLLVPGLGGVGRFWAPLLPALSQTHFVVIHDHRGTGQSSLDRIDFSIDQMAGDVLALMDALEIASASLVGHSTGGAIGQVLALDHARRIERLVLSSTWARPDAYFRHLFAVRKQILTAGGAAPYLNSSALFMSPPADLRHNLPPLLDEVSASAQLPDPELVVRRIDAILDFDRSTELDRIGHPVLVSCARDDLITPFYNSEVLASAIPAARTAFVDSGGHFYPVTQPELFSRAVIPFLNAAG